jgi:hypothetical protein
VGYYPLEVFMLRGALVGLTRLLGLYASLAVLVVMSALWVFLAPQLMTNWLDRLFGSTASKGLDLLWIPVYVVVILLLGKCFWFINSLDLQYPDAAITRGRGAVAISLALFFVTVMAIINLELPSGPLQYASNWLLGLVAVVGVSVVERKWGRRPPRSGAPDGNGA